jgi:hypothetical protein
VLLAYLPLLASLLLTASLSAPTAVRAGFLAVLAGVPDIDSIPHCCAILLTFSGIPVPAVAG